MCLYFIEMNFITFIKYAFLLLIIDSIYLNLVSGFFNKQVYVIQGSNISMDYLAATLCYIFLLSSWLYFIKYKNGTVLDAFILGTLIYGVFETTNKAIFKKWNWKSVIIDTIWGGILFSLFTIISNKFM